MGEIIMNLVMRLVGMGLLVAAGTGAGICFCLHKRQEWWQAHTFARLLLYMGRLLGYQRLTGAEMLRRAARYPDFQTLGVETCDELAALSAPESLPEALRQEVQQGLLHLGEEPRAEAGATLERLASLCEEAAERNKKEAEDASRLWPRLGACVGVLVAILIG